MLLPCQALKRAQYVLSAHIMLIHVTDTIMYQRPINSKSGKGYSEIKFQVIQA